MGHESMGSRAARSTQKDLSLGCANSLACETMDVCRRARVALGASTGVYYCKWYCRMDCLTCK